MTDTKKITKIENQEQFDAVLDAFGQHDIFTKECGTPEHEEAIRLSVMLSRWAIEQYTGCKDCIIV